MLMRGRMLDPGFAAAAAALVLLLVTVFPTVPCGAKRDIHHDCTSSCGNIRNISYPFRLKDDPRSCGRREYELVCENNRTLFLPSYSRKFRVEEINYEMCTIRVVDPDILEDGSSSLPLHSLIRSDFYSDIYWASSENSALNFIDCESRVNSSRYMDMAPCIGSKNTFLSSIQTYPYVVVGSMQLLELEDSCRIDVEVIVSAGRQRVDNTSCSGIHDRLLYGTDLEWSYQCPHLGDAGSSLPWYQVVRDVAIATAEIVFSYIVVPSFPVKILLGSPCVIIFLIYKWRRRNLFMYHTIEEFIQAQNNLTPIRYSYSNIKKMTKGFKEKLGQGGYGSVYKGKLRSGRFVAVKVMTSSKGDGQDFINEVATVGRIHHINVVQLTGFCVEGTKRALVFDFMPNGSLEKHIFPESKGNASLDSGKMFEISLGIARGIEYLHRGCDSQILHFDIKPHNILLDDNFIPKISDFGLSKSYPVDHSIVSLTGTRGTRGYMAPELFYKNIGGVSYKADVYSFGMMLMEMAGRRRNLNLNAENSSQFYFPTWIYDKFSEGEEIELMEDATEEAKEFSKKLIIVALWCIQLKPSDRPSMKKVVEMLQGNVELLQMPPRPLLTPQQMPTEDQVNEQKPIDMSISTG